MTDTQTNSEAGPNPGEGGPFYHVNNDLKGHIEAHGEDLTGAEILSRVALDGARYELFNVEHGHATTKIKLTDIVHVKPGDHFRAVPIGADYSSGETRS
jgi:hypothetical protein